MAAAGRNVTRAATTTTLRRCHTAAGKKMVKKRRNGARRAGCAPIEHRIGVGDQRRELGGQLRVVVVAPGERQLARRPLIEAMNSRTSSLD